MTYRGCSATGLRFAALGRQVSFNNVTSYQINVTPRSPDCSGQRTAFASAEDPGEPAFGTWFIDAPGAAAVRPAGITWRSWYPGRFDPAGVYHLSGKKGDLGYESGRATRWTWADGVLTGPIATGTTNIEGIAAFEPDGTGWRPVWQNRGQPVTVDGYTLPLWFRFAHWLFGINSPTERSIAKDLRTGIWYLVTEATSPVIPCVHEQDNGTLLVAWNGDQETFLWSGDGWPVLTEPPVVIPVFPTTTQKIGIGLFDDLDGPRIQDYSEVVSENTRAIFWQIGTAGESKSEALARSLNVEALAYKDGYGITPRQIPVGFRALVFAYPTAGMPITKSLHEVELALQRLENANTASDLAMALYCQYRKPGDYALELQQVMDMARGVWDLAREYRVGAVWAFTKRRLHHGQVVDGVDYWPELRECYDRLKQASGDWQTFPPYAPPVPPPAWFTKGQSFLMADQKVRGLRVTVDWDYQTHQAIHRFLRVPPGGGDETIFWDAVEPGPETEVLLRRRGTGECDALFTLAQRELALQPDTRWWQTRPKDAVGPFETFRDVAQPPNGLKTLVHVYGQLAEVVV